MHFCRSCTHTWVFWGKTDHRCSSKISIPNQKLKCILKMHTPKLRSLNSALFESRALCAWQWSNSVSEPRETYYYYSRSGSETQLEKAGIFHVWWRTLHDARRPGKGTLEIRYTVFSALLNTFRSEPPLFKLLASLTSNLNFSRNDLLNTHNYKLYPR